MSEVHRYKVVKMVTAGGNKLTYTPHGPEIVMAEHYDALAAQRDEAVAAHEALGKVCSFRQLGFEKMRAQRDEGLAREAELQKENRLLRHESASFLQTMAKTCELLGIDRDSAKQAPGKPSDVLYAHAKALQQRLAEAEKLLRECNEGFKDFISDPFIRRIETFFASPGCADGEPTK
jgi:hypothetical protein